MERATESDFTVETEASLETWANEIRALLESGATIHLFRTILPDGDDVSLIHKVVEPDSTPFDIDGYLKRTQNSPAFGSPYYNGTLDLGDVDALREEIELQNQRIV